MQTTTMNNGPVTVKVGLIMPISGPVANLGTDSVHAYQTAADNFNKSQSGFKIELITEDGKCNGQDATAAAQKLVNIDQVKVIIGGACSSEMLSAMQVTAPAKVVLLSPTASSPEIAKKATDYSYRLYTDLNQSKTIADFLNNKKAEKIALIYENTDYGVGLAKALTDRIGADRIAVQQAFNTDEKDFSILAKNIAAKKSEYQFIVYIPNSDTTSINVIKALDTEGLINEFKGKILASEAGYSTDVAKKLGATSEGILVTTMPAPTNLGSKAEKFVNQIKETYTPSFPEAFLVLFGESFDTVAAGISDPQYGIDKMNEYMKSLTKDNPRDGLFGDYYFDGADAVGLNFLVREIKNGVLVDYK